MAFLRIGMVLVLRWIQDGMPILLRVLGLGLLCLAMGVVLLPLMVIGICIGIGPLGWVCLDPAPHPIRRSGLSRAAWWWIVGGMAMVPLIYWTIQGLCVTKCLDLSVSRLDPNWGPFLSFFLIDGAKNSHALGVSPHPVLRSLASVAYGGIITSAFSGVVGLGVRMVQDACKGLPRYTGWVRRQWQQEWLRHYPSAHAQVQWKRKHSRQR